MLSTNFSPSPSSEDTILAAGQGRLAPKWRKSYIKFREIPLVFVISWPERDARELADGGYFRKMSKTNLKFRLWPINRRPDDDVIGVLKSGPAWQAVANLVKMLPDRVYRLWTACEHGYWNLFMRGGLWTLLRAGNELAICFSWEWYHWKEEVHAVIFSYSTSKSIYGAPRYPHLTLEKLKILNSFT